MSNKSASAAPKFMNKAAILKKIQLKIDVATADILLDEARVARDADDTQ